MESKIRTCDCCGCGVVISPIVSIGLDHGNTQTQSRCSICGLWYDTFFCIKITPDVMCWHCLFGINHEKKDKCDGVYGPTISDYIILCVKDHDTTKCPRTTNHVGCFLCEFKIGFIIDGIKHPELIYNKKHFPKNDGLLIEI